MLFQCFAIIFAGLQEFTERDIYVPFNSESLHSKYCMIWVSFDNFSCELLINAMKQDINLCQPEALTSLEYHIL